MVLQRFASVFSRYSDQKTMKYFCNRLFDKMFKSKNVTEDSVVKFGRAIDFHVKDVKLNKLLKKCFGQYNAYEIKSIIENTPDEELSKLSTVDAQRCLMNVINEEKDESIRQFIKMLCLPIQSYLEWCYDEYKTKVGLDEELFPDYVLEDIVKTKYFNKCGFVHSEYCLLSHFIQCNFEEETLMGKNEYLNIEIDLEKCDSIKSIVKMLVTNYQIINNVISAKGNNYSGTFKGALNLVNKLTPVWDKLLASSLMRDRSPQTPPQTSSNNLSDEEMFSVYAGKYSLVPRSYPEVTKISANMIFNMHQFKQLSQQRKKQVCAYLENNKSRFNRLLNDAAETIHNELSDKLNYSNVCDLLSSDSSGKLYKCASLLNDSFNSHAFNSPDKLLSYVVHEYIPIIKQFNNLNDDLCENIKKNIYGGAPNNDIVDLIRGGIGLNDVFDEIYEYKPSPTPTPVPSPTPKAIPSPVPSPVPSPTSKTVPKANTIVKRIYGGEDEFKTIEDYVKILMNIQKRFNSEYETFYKDLTTELNKVILPKEIVDKSRLYNIIQQFEQIAIKNPKTTCYISGIYGAKNYNGIYSDMVKTLIMNIDQSNYGFLNDVSSKLKDVLNLLKSTAKQINDIQIKMLSSPRGDNDYMIMNTRKILKPSNLNSDDFNNLTIAIRKILTSINSTRVESDVYNFKNSLKKFIEKVGDRTKMIQEYYELEKQRFLYENQESFFDYKSRNGNVQRINNILINRKADAMIYMNSVVDMELAKAKENIKDASIDEKDMKNIEEIYLNFKYAQSSNEMEEVFDKLKSLGTNTYEGILTVIKKLKKLFKISGQVKMLIDIYRKLKIFPDDFDWSKFEHEYIDLIVLNSVKIGRIYKMNIEDKYNKTTLNMTYSQITETLANSCECACMKKLKLYQTNYEDRQEYTVSKIVYQMINALFNDMIDEYRFSKILENREFKFVDVLNKRLQKDYDIRFNNINDETYCAYLRGDLDGYWTIYACTKKEIETRCDNKMVFTDRDTIRTLFKNIEADKLADNKIYELMNKLACTMIAEINDKYKFRYKIQNNTPYYIKHWPVAIVEFITAIRSVKSIQDFMYGSTSVTNNFGISMVKDRNIECDIATYSIEALYANIADYIDSYWKLKYNGTLPIVQSISNALRGGSKLDGASIIDHININATNYSEIIDDAVPFYVVAMNIMEYYITHYYLTKDDGDKDELRLRLKFNKLSILYPIYKILGKNSISLNGLTEQYIRECLYVLNKIWNMTDGDLGIKLSKSVDILLNEIHSNFLFTSKASEDILEFSETPSSQSAGMMDLNIEMISKTLKNILQDTFVSTTESNKYLETYLRNAYETVKGGGTNKLMILRNFLTDKAKNNYYDDFYNFMDLVIAPLLIISESYKKKFSLFKFKGPETINDEKTDVLDFNKTDVIYLDMTTEYPTLRSINVSSIIYEIKNGKPEYKSLLFYNPIVTQYNQNLLRRALYNFHKTNKFIIPKFWIVMDESTYPLRNSEKIITDEQPVVSSDTINKIIHIWGYIDGQTVSDYYNQCILEFVSDFNHIIQLFVSYPGVSDKAIKRISDALKDAIKVKCIDFKYDTHSYIILNINNSRHEETLKKFSNIKIKDIKTSPVYIPYIKPTQIPPLNTNNVIEGLSIVSSPRDAIRIGKTRSYLRVPSLSNDEKIDEMDYTWTDWVVFMIAKCDTVNFCLPYKLINMLQSQSGLQKYIRQPAYKSREQRLIYMTNTAGVSNNIITQNIVARSLSDHNKERLEYSSLPQIQIANIISMLPYIISYLKIDLKFLTMRDYNGAEQYTINSLIETLTLFFYDISTFTPYIGFMTDSLEIMGGKDRVHLFGEVFADMYSVNELTTADDFLHVEWANKIFFSYISEIKFPEYKSKPQFSKYEELVKDKIIQPSFKNVYENTKSVVARNLWGYLLAKGPTNTINDKNDKELDKLIVDILYIMANCSDSIIQAYLNNVIKKYNNDEYTYDEKLRKLIESLIRGVASGNIKSWSEYLLNYSGEIDDMLNDSTNEFTKFINDIRCVYEGANDRVNEIKEMRTVINNLTDEDKEDDAVLVGGDDNDKLLNFENYLVLNDKNIEKNAPELKPMMWILKYIAMFNEKFYQTISENPNNDVKDKFGDEIELFRMAVQWYIANMMYVNSDDSAPNANKDTLYVNIFVFNKKYSDVRDNLRQIIIDLRDYVKNTIVISMVIKNNIFSNGFTEAMEAISQELSRLDKYNVSLKSIVLYYICVAYFIHTDNPLTCRDISYISINFKDVALNIRDDIGPIKVTKYKEPDLDQRLDINERAMIKGCKECPTLFNTYKDNKDSAPIYKHFTTHKKNIFGFGTPESSKKSSDAESTPVSSDNEEKKNSDKDTSLLSDNNEEESSNDENISVLSDNNEEESSNESTPVSSDNDKNKKSKKDENIFFSSDNNEEKNKKSKKDESNNEEKKNSEHKKKSKKDESNNEEKKNSEDKKNSKKRKLVIKTIDSDSSDHDELEKEVKDKKEILADLRKQIFAKIPPYYTVKNKPDISIIRDYIKAHPNSCVNDSTISKFMNEWLEVDKPTFTFRDVACTIAVLISSNQQSSIIYRANSKIYTRPNTLNSIKKMIVDDISSKIEKLNKPSKVIVTGGEGEEDEGEEDKSEELIKMYAKLFGLEIPNNIPPPKSYKMYINIDNVKSYMRLDKMDLRSLCNTDFTDLKCKTYVPKFNPLMIFINNLDIYPRRDIINITLSDKMFGYIFGSSAYRKYYIISPRCDIQNAAIYENIYNICAKNNKTYYHIFHNMILGSHDSLLPRLSTTYIPKSDYYTILKSKKDNLTEAYANLYDVETADTKTELDEARKHVDEMIKIYRAVALNLHEGGFNCIEPDESLRDTRLNEIENWIGTWAENRHKILKDRKKSLESDEDEEYTLSGKEKKMKKGIETEDDTLSDEDDTLSVEEKKMKEEVMKGIETEDEDKEIVTNKDKINTKMSEDERKDSIYNEWKKMLGDLWKSKYSIMNCINTFDKNQYIKIYKNTENPEEYILPDNLGKIYNDENTSENAKKYIVDLFETGLNNVEVTMLTKYFDFQSLNLGSKENEEKSESKAFNLDIFTNMIMNGSFGKIDIRKDVNNGFATQLRMMRGGYTKFDILCNYINLDNYKNGKRNEFKYLYEYENDLSEAKRLFDALFRAYATYYNQLQKQSDIITIGAFNYFHKFNLSCASIYNRILFPNIIYNASILRNYISSISRSIQRVEMNDNTLNDIFKFISNMTGYSYGADALDLVNDWRYNIVFGKRNPNETYSTFNNSTIKLSNYAQLAIANINSTPSLINKFLIKLLTDISPVPGKNDKDMLKFAYENSLVSGLYNTPFMIEMNHINLLNTTVYSLLRILKTTSFYDVETDTDYAYNNGLILEPFVE